MMTVSTSDGLEKIRLFLPPSSFPNLDQSRSQSVSVCLLDLIEITAPARLMTDWLTEAVFLLCRHKYHCCSVLPSAPAPPPSALGEGWQWGRSV